MLWIFSLKLGFVRVNPILFMRNFQSLWCVRSPQISPFLSVPFSPETIPKRKLFFQSLIGFFSVWWPQPSAPERENRPRLKPNFKDRGPVLARSLLERGWEFGTASEFFSDKVAERALSNRHQQGWGFQLTEQTSERSFSQYRRLYTKPGIFCRWQFMTKQLAPFS